MDGVAGRYHARTMKGAVTPTRADIQGARQHSNRFSVFRFPFTSRCVCSEPVRVKSGYSDAHRLGGFVSFRFISISFSFLVLVFVFGFRFHFSCLCFVFVFVFCFRVLLQGGAALTRTR
eukprot:COSAG06_NODE_22488_length_721_cov_1355.321543_1_plen_119_part_00